MHNLNKYGIRFAFLMLFSLLSISWITANAQTYTTEGSKITVPGDVTITAANGIEGPIIFKEPGELVISMSGTGMISCNGYLLYNDASCS